MNLDKFYDIALINGISSFEKNIASYLSENLNVNGNEIYKDGLSSLIVEKNNNRKINLMFATHMDEVGYIVSNIENNLLKLQSIGSFWNHLVLGELYVLENKIGEKFYGPISSPPSHGISQEIKEKVISNDNIYLDIGLRNEDLINNKIEIGNPVTPFCPRLNFQGDSFISKAIDNRISCYIGYEIMKGTIKNPNNLYWAFTTQEEPGLRGARTSSDLIKPDIAFAIDTTLAGDYKFAKNSVKLGGGVGLSFIDSNSISHRGLMRWVEEICKEENIKYQYAVFNKGGTDSGNIHKTHEGVINMSLAIPVRYMHTNYSIANRKDVDECIKLVKRIIEKMDEEVFINLWEI